MSLVSRETIEPAEVDCKGGSEMRLREERLRRGWSQTRVAALSGIASPDVSALERGVKPVYPGWRRRLAEVFGMTEEELFGPAAPAEGQR